MRGTNGCARAMVALGIAWSGLLRAQTAEATRFNSLVRVCAGGDVTLGTNLDPDFIRRGEDSLRRFYGVSSSPDSLVAPARPLFAEANIVLINVEGAIGEGPVLQPKCLTSSTDCFAFRQPPAAAPALRSLGGSRAVVVANLANNHSRDAGNTGFAATRDLLEESGILVTGADTLATPVVTGDGDTVAFLGFHSSKDNPDSRDLAAVRRHVARAVQQFRTVIVTVHIGAEGPTAQRTRNAMERFAGEERGNPIAFADAAIQAGATIVVGHGPHVLRAGEWRGDRLILYSMGNLITYGPFGLHEPTNRGAILCASIDGPGHVASAELRATKQRVAGAFLPDSTRRAYALVDSLSALDFPRTGVLVGSDGKIGRPDTLRAGRPPAG